MPDLLWKAYIDFEKSVSEFESTRQLYERLRDRTKHFNVWISYAIFEASAGFKDGMDSELQESDEDYIEKNKERCPRSRQIFDIASSYLRTTAPELK